MATTTEKLEDPNLNEEDQDAIIGAFVRYQENERLRKHWEKLLAEKHQVSRPAPASRRSAVIRNLLLPVLAIAATFLLLFIFLPGFSGAKGKEVLATSLTELTIEGTRSEPLSAADSLRRELRTAYSAGDYLAAAASGQRLLTLPDATEEDRLNLGMSLLLAENYYQANQHFYRLLETSGDFSTDARYFLGLSLLSSGEITAGLTELRKIGEADGRDIYQKAQALIGARW